MTRTLALLLVVASALVTTRSDAAMVSITPTVFSATAGSTFSVDVAIDGLDTLTDQRLGTYSLVLGWNPALLAFGGITFDGFLDGPADSIQDWIAGPGVLDVAETSLLTLDSQQGLAQFRLFSVSFTALAVGWSSLTLDGVVLGDAFGEPIDAAVGDARVEIPGAPPAVPEPGSLALLVIALAMAGMAAVRRPPNPTLVAASFATLSALALGSPAAHAEAGWTYRQVGPDFRSGGVPEPTEQTLACFGMNDLGHVAYLTSSPLTVQATHHRYRLYYFDGATTALLLDFRSDDPEGRRNPCLLSSSSAGIKVLGLNNDGLVAFDIESPDPQGQGRVREFLFVKAGTPVRAVREINPRSSLALNEAGQVAFADPTFPTRRIVLTPGTVASGAASPALDPFNALAGPSLNDQRRAAALGLNGATNEVRLFAFDAGAGVLPSRALFNFLERSTLNQTPGLNERGFMSVLSGGDNFRPNARLRVELVRPDLSGTVVLYDNGDSGRFANFPNSEHSSLNDFNTVLFGNWIGAQPAGLQLVDPSGQLPWRVVRSGQTLQASGRTVTLSAFRGGEPFVGTRSLNDAGEVIFAAEFTPAGSGLARVGIFVASPVAGWSPANPTLPEPIAGCVQQSVNGACMRVERAITVAGRIAYIDPPIAIGYDYLVQLGGPNVGSVYIPRPLPNGDATFEIEFAGLKRTLRAEERFDITAEIPAGVQSFRITGIGAAESISPTDFTVFVTGIGFVGEASADFAVSMTPIVQEPPVMTCDADRDGDVDRNDVSLITAARNQPASGPDDPRDADKNGVINVLDARRCTSLCTRPSCATQ